MKRTFTVILEPDLEEGGFTVVVPGLPGCVTEGDTREEALANAREAIVGHLRALAKVGQRPPEGDVEVDSVQVDVAI